MPYDEDDGEKEEGNDRTCEWCHMRPAMEEHFIFGLSPFTHGDEGGMAWGRILRRALEALVKSKKIRETLTSRFP